MKYNRKFEKNARSRRVFAFTLALALHLGLLAAVIFGSDLGQYLPEFFQQLFSQTPPPNVP